MNRPLFEPGQSHLKPPSHIRAVTFDVGGTLIETFPSMGHVYADVAANHGYPNIPPGLLKQRFVAAWREFEEFNYSRADWARLVDATFEGLIEKLPSDTFFPELYERFAQPQVWRVFPDVLPTLEKLGSSGLKLAIISNWDERLRPLLHALGLASYFETIIISCEVGCCKPSREIFQTSAHKLELSPPEILHVGDSPENDSEGARAAGFQACLLLRESQSSRPGQIQSLDELYC
jgi:putative hydrolase of the HAD superfamily